MAEYTANQIFDAWFFYVRENHDIRYIHRERPEIVSDLAYKFKKHGIDYDEAIMFTKKVILKLTTDEGRKGRGKYSGWKEAVEEDFKAALASEYVETEPKPVEETSQATKTTVQKYIIPEDQWINGWLRSKFGEKYPKEIKDLAHTIGSSLNTQFLMDVFESDWVETDENIPKWLENTCIP